MQSLHFSVVSYASRIHGDLGNYMSRWTDIYTKRHTHRVTTGHTTSSAVHAQLVKTSVDKNGSCIPSTTSLLLTLAAQTLLPDSQHESID